jgi:aminomethyltransferase
MVTGHWYNTECLEMIMPVNETSYTGALEHVAIADERAAGRIFMRGRDRAALLHRLSTNDIERLNPGEGTLTALTTPIGRIIDLLTVHALDDTLLIVTSPDQGPPVFGHLRRNIFFNDQVTLEPAGRTYTQVAVYGPQAARTLAELIGAEIHLPLHGITPATLAGVSLLLARRKPIGGDSFTLYVPSDGADAVYAALLTAGAAALDAETLDVLRVEQGYGAFGRELSQEYIPLETGLLDAVSFTKGCYVGQEIIARMESRGRLAKRLCGLRLSHPVVAPAKLQVDGRDAGDLTSAVVSPRFGPIALAYVRTAYAEPGTVVGVDGFTATGRVIELPFAV